MLKSQSFLIAIIASMTSLGLIFIVVVVSNAVPVPSCTPLINLIRIVESVKGAAPLLLQFAVEKCDNAQFVALSSSSRLPS